MEKGELQQTYDLISGVGVDRGGTASMKPMIF
jgi:hypothetical protein